MRRVLLCVVFAGILVAIGTIPATGIDTASPRTPATDPMPTI